MLHEMLQIISQHVAPTGCWSSGIFWEDPPSCRTSRSNQWSCCSAYTGTFPSWCPRALEAVGGRDSEEGGEGGGGEDDEDEDDDKDDEEDEDEEDDDEDKND